MASRIARTQKTWSLLGDVRRKPSTYEVTAARFHYHFRKEPAPFELDPGMPLNRWYLEYRRGLAVPGRRLGGLPRPAQAHLQGLRRAAA